MTSSVRRYLAGAVTVPGRISDLENALSENRQLDQRLDELTGILAELLVPVAQRDHEKLTALLGTTPTTRSSN